jgi:tRNA/tmRNA/rRNA uracil-C5-methylase (TrmA/RlmC/RlmD family)
MHPRGIRQLVNLKIPRIIYISCNPSTFARDASDLARGGYELVEVTPVDMFPHTMHIELVSRFDLTT